MVVMPRNQDLKTFFILLLLSAAFQQAIILLVCTHVHACKGKLDL